MTTSSEYALLSAAAYADLQPLTQNRAPVPAGWSEIPDYAVNGSGNSYTFLGSGFTAKVFKGPGNEIVISFAGTDPDFSMSMLADFLTGNVPLSLGDLNFGRQKNE